jgi:ABC-type phosphate transport system substrate-binding protein
MPLPAEQIHAFSSSEPGGSGFIFNQWLALSVPSWQKAVGVSLLPAWPVGCSIGVPSSGAMVQSVLNTPYSIGFVGFDFAISNQMQAAALRNASGVFVTPSLNGLAKAIGYQLSRGMSRNFRTPFVTVPGKDAFNPACFEFFLVHQNLKATALPTDRKQAIKGFLEWTINDKGGQQFIESIELRRVGKAPALAHGFVPVPPEIRETSQKVVDSIAL